MDATTKPITILKNLRIYFNWNEKQGVEIKKGKQTQEQGDGMGIDEWSSLCLIYNWDCSGVYSMVI